MALVLSFPSAGPSSAFPDNLTPHYVYLTWASPDTAHTINVSWRTDENYVGEVHYDNEPRGGDPGAYSDNTEGVGGVTTVKFDGYIHHVELTGLEPDTTYYFICGHPDNGWSDEQSFRTAPDQRTSFRFVTGGDSRDDNRWDYHDYWPSARDDVSREMAERNPSFVLFLGDYLWSSEAPGPGYAENDTWDNWLGAAFKYWRTDDNRLIPQIPVIGNHEIVYPEPSNYDPETDATNYYTVFNLPGNERWYALSWGPDLRIIVLDSEVLDEDSGTWQEQLAWLESELENSENYPWKVAAFHRPIVSSGWDGWNWHGRLEDWGYLFTKYGVDVVFQAHIHWYERLYPIDSDPPPGEIAPLGEGVVYTVSGGWGGPLSTGSPENYTAYGPESRYHFMLIDVFENGMLHSQAIDQYGTVFDEFSLYQVWTETAVFSLVNLYTVNVEKILTLNQGSKLVVKFYTYGDAFENENVIENFTTPPTWHVEENENARHPEGTGVKKARLDLTTDNTENVISTLSTFVVHKVDLEARFMDIPFYWSQADPAGKLDLEAEFMEIPFYWSGAPS